MKAHMVRTAVCGAVAAAVVAVTGAIAGMAGHAADGAPVVAVTIKPVHALAAQVMQGIAAPVLIVEGSASPHTFTLKPSAARTIQSAGVLVRVSEEIEPFTRKLADSLPQTVTLLTLADAAHGVKLLARRTSGTFEAHTHGVSEGQDDHADHDAHETHGGQADASHGFDGHIWLDPENAKAIISALAKTLSERYPAHAAAFAANAVKASASIDTLSAAIASDLAAVKGRPFVVFHDAYQYFEARFGMPASGSITMSPDQQPSAKRLTEVRKKIAGLEAACVFAEPQFQPKLVAAVTEGTSARTGTLDPEGLALTPGPNLYAELMTNLARDMKACLAPGP